MIISASSHNVQLTDEICEYADNVLNSELGHVADQVMSVDVRLEATQDVPARRDMKAVVRVDLRNHRPLVFEIEDNDLHAAIRRGAADSARAVERQVQYSQRLVGQPMPEKFHVFGRYPAPNL
jgi:ribosome-associated translation inhibitor RaiA